MALRQKNTRGQKKPEKQESNMLSFSRVIAECFWKENLANFSFSFCPFVVKKKPEACQKEISECWKRIEFLRGEKVSKNSFGKFLFITNVLVGEF